MFQTIYFVDRFGKQWDEERLLSLPVHEIDDLQLHLVDYGEDA